MIYRAQPGSVRFGFCKDALDDQGESRARFCRAAQPVHAARDRAPRALGDCRRRYDHDGVPGHRVFVELVCATADARRSTGRSRTMMVTFSISIFSLGVGAVIGGRWQDRVGPRNVAVYGILFWAFGNAAGRRVHAGIGCVVALNLTYGVIGGFGLGMGYVSPVAMVTQVVPRPSRSGRRPRAHRLRVGRVRVQRGALARRRVRTGGREREHLPRHGQRNARRRRARRDAHLRVGRA